MATYSRQALDRYFGTIDNLRDAAAKELEARVMTYFSVNGMDEMFREFVRREYHRIWLKYGLAVDEAACLFFEMAMRGILGDEAALRSQGWASERSDRLVERLLTEYADDPEGFASQLSGRMRDYVKDAAGYSMARNVSRNSASGVRFARVLRGEKNCTYCVTLASRGFVYKSMDSAARASHHYCDCEFVPGMPDTEIEGVSQEKLLNDYTVFTEIDKLQRRRGQDEGLTQEECARLKEAFFDAPHGERERIYRQYVGKEMPTE